MSIDIYPSPDVSFTLVSNRDFFAKNVKTNSNLEFVIELNFDFEILPPDENGNPIWKRMRATEENIAKLEFFAEASNGLFQIINKILLEERDRRDGGLQKTIFGASKLSNLYREYDDYCKRASNEFLTVYGRWNGSKG